MSDHRFSVRVRDPDWDPVGRNRDDWPEVLCYGSHVCQRATCLAWQRERFARWPDGPWCSSHPGQWSPKAVREHTADFASLKLRPGRRV